MAEKGAAGAELPALAALAEAVKQRSVQPFLTKTYQLVDDPATDSVISWNEDGSSFIVWRPAEFDSFASFVRQLNTYGFRKVAPDRWEFGHDFFRRGEKPLLCDIHRRNGKPRWQSPSPPKQACPERSMEASVCALVGAMFKLPAKLDRLLVSYGHTLPRGAKEEIPLIKQDLEKMVAILQVHDDSGAEDCSMMVRCLTKEVRELSYDMEDSVDQYVHATDSRRGILSPRRKKYKITHHRSKASMRLREKLKWRLWMANKIREFSVRSQEALQRYSLFNHLGDNGVSAAAIGGTGSSTSPRADASLGSWRPTPYGRPIGIDEHVNKLEAWLGKDGEQKLKVVSVVGSGGIGKTTLAKELYRRIGGQFECRAFVRTSRKPDVRRLLISMLSQIQPHQPPHNWKVHSLIADIRTHLQDKRYLIVIDDVSGTQTWDIINRALPAGNLSSGILITTEVDDVALKCCGYDSKYVLTMKQLGHDDSRKLFFSTVFGPQYECPPELSEVGDSIIRKCAGLPLAMVTVASLLVNHMGKPEQWYYVDKSLGYGLKTNPTSEGMKQVLNLSYSNLPQHLKPCVMYLSIYEEDYIIQKDDLVKQWIAESFIHATEEKDKEGISRSYFDQLISSRMILPVHINDNDDVLSCMVHHIVLDFLTQKSLEENFVTAIDHCQTTARLADKVRRLSLHFGNAEATPPTNMRLSQVRTLAFFGVFKCLPSIVEFGLLQVLILHLWGDDESISVDLTGISELFRLRYLHVTCNATLEVPQTQMRGLQYLETLKIDARVSAVPSDIVHLPGLLHLSLPVDTNLPNGIGSMTSLCTLGYFDLSVNSIDNVQSLGGLTNLQDLRLTCSTVPSSYLKSKMDNMGAILAKLSNLRSVTLEPSSILDSGPSSMSISCDGLSSVSSPPALLQRFEWLPCICTFSSIPKWIGHLNKLCILKIGVRELASNDVDVLRGLPALTVLSLYVRTKPAERIVFTKTGFSVLKCFKFRCSVPWLEFEVDAMPNLLKLKLIFDAHGVDQHCTIPVGIVHLTGLKEISAKIGGAGASDPDRRAAESALIDAIKIHPACPTFNIQCLDEMFNGKDDNNSGVQDEEVEHMTLQKQYEIMEEDSNEQHGLLQKGSREDAHCRFLAFSDWKNVAENQPGSSSKCQIEETTGLSSSRIWTRWLKTVEQREEHRNLQKQCAGMEEDSNKQHVALQKDSSEDATRRYAHGRRCVKPKPTWTVFRRSLGDGYSWKKYGQKDIRGSAHPRGYYRCSTHTGCEAIMHVQKLDSDPGLYNITYLGEHGVTYKEATYEEAVQCTYADPRLFGITYKGNQNHTCTPVANAPLQHGVVADWAFSWITADRLAKFVDPAGSLQGLQHRQQREPKWTVRTRTLNDGYSWEKYGQSIVHDAKHQRSGRTLTSTSSAPHLISGPCMPVSCYYHCVHKDCKAKRHVQKLDGDPDLCEITYLGEHTCVQSPARTGSQVRYEEASGSTAGVCFTSAATSSSQVTYEEAVQCTDGDPRPFGITYRDNHTCTPVANAPLQHGHEESSVSSVGSVQELQHREQRKPMRSTKVGWRGKPVLGKLRANSVDADGLSWRKYGQKEIQDGKYPRSYYRCVYKWEKGCGATKQVQPTDSDPQLFDIIYYGNHTCGQSMILSLQQPRQEQSSVPAMPESSPFISTLTSEREITGEAVSGSFMSVATSSQVTNEDPRESTDGSWSAPDEVDYSEVDDDFLDSCAVRSYL